MYREKECPLLAENESLFGGGVEVGNGVCVVLETQAVQFIFGKTLEGDEGQGDIVRTLMRQEVPDQHTAAARNDCAPALGVARESGLLKRIDHIADAADNGHGRRVLFSVPKDTALPFRHISINIEA